MKKCVFSNKVALVMGTSMIAILAAGQGEAFAQGCPSPGISPSGDVVNPCAIGGGTVIYNPAGVIFGSAYRIYTGGMVTNNATLSSTDNTVNAYVFLFPLQADQLFGATQLNFTNNGTITGSGSFPVIASNYVGLAGSIINTGKIYTANTSLAPFTPRPPSAGTYAIDITRASNFTIENRAGAEIIGAAGAVRIGAEGTGALIKVTNAGLMEAASANRAAFTLLGTNTTGAINSGSFILNEATGVIKGAGYGIMVSTPLTAGAFTGLTITNRGTIEGVSFTGILLGINAGGVIINNYGTISGRAQAIDIFNGGGNTFNIYPGAVFTNGIAFNNSTGNTLNFHTGSYTLGVKNYLVASNTINATVAGTQSVTSGLDGTGTGDIQIVAAQVATTAPVVTNTVAASVSNVVNSVATAVPSAIATTVSGAATTIVPPVQGFTPEPPAPSPDSPGFGSDYRAYDPAAPAGTPATGVQVYTLANLNPTLNMDVLKAKQGQKMDAYGNLAWARGFGSMRELPSTARVVGHSNWMAGMMFGVDRNLDGLRLGIYGGYAYGSTKMKDSSGSLTTDYYIGGVYARRNFGEYVVMANLPGGLLANRMSRSINLGQQQAKASFDGGFIAPELSISRDHALAPGWMVTPTLRARYVGAFMPSYRESGSSQNVAYGSSASHALEERLEVKLARVVSREPGLASSFYVQAAAIASQRIGGDSMNASLLGTSFIIRNPHDRNTVGGMIGVGFDHALTRQVTAFGGVDASYYTDKTRSVVGRAGVKIAF